MFRTVNCLMFKRCVQFMFYQHLTKNLLTKRSPTLFVSGSKLFLGTSIGCTIVSPIKIQNMDIEEVQKALRDGDVALMNLIDELKDFVKVVSEEYRKCLKKQIEITEKSQNVGPLSETWDELPKYRTLADELLQQLNNYKALFQTLGTMAESKFSVGINEATDFAVFMTKFKQSQEVIEKEFLENRKLEKILLEINCESILIDVVTDSHEK